MILRFRTNNEGQAHYLALNTDTGAYTQGAAAMSTDFEAPEINPAAYSYILDELNFNAWAYTDNIYLQPDITEVPGF